MCIYNESFKFTYVKNIVLLRVINATSPFRFTRGETTG